MLFVGDDWAEDHHDVELMDAAGRRLAAARLPEGVAGITRLHEMIGALPAFVIFLRVFFHVPVSEFFESAFAALRNALGDRIFAIAHSVHDVHRHAASLRDTEVANVCDVIPARLAVLTIDALESFVAGRLYVNS